jgi:3-hydroxyacyl-CoA dehydrogenase
MDIKTFGVVGAGQMGNGIAQVAAMSGFEVIMNDIKTEFVERGLETIRKKLDQISAVQLRETANEILHPGNLNMLIFE